MNWYKRAQTEFLIEDFGDRNALNEKISKLEEIAGRLSYASLLIFQAQREARKLVQSALQDKTLSSYPDVIKILGEADTVALDSPYKFKDICLIGMDEIARRASNLKKQRKRWADEGGFTKGL